MFTHQKLNRRRNFFYDVTHHAVPIAARLKLSSSLLVVLSVTGCIFGDPATTSLITNKTTEPIQVELVLQKERYGVTSSDKAVALAPDWIKEFEHGEGVTLIAIDPSRLTGKFEIAGSGYLFAHASLGTQPHIKFVKLSVTKNNKTLRYINLQAITRLFKPTDERYTFEFQITDELFNDSNDDENLFDSELQTIYATTISGCDGSAESLITVYAQSLSGPQLSCSLSNSQPAGTGLVEYNGECLIDKSNVVGAVVFDFGNYKDHFKVSLPGKENWIPLYPCTQIPKLQP